MRLLTPVLLLLAIGARAQSTVIGDAWFSGRLGVGTTSPAATIDVVNATTTTAAFQVSAVDETPFLQVASSGAVGVGVVPSAKLDVTGLADESAISLQLHNGNSAGTSGSFQLALGVNGSADLRHAISTTHSTAAVGGSIDFFVWSPAVSTTAIGSLEPLSLVTASTGASMHVMPVGTPDVELEVSNGASIGGGTVHRASEGTHSSRKLKTEIVYLGADDARAAYADVAALHHVRFRYKSLKKGRLVDDRHQPVHRGLIFEETPASIRGAGDSVLVDERLTNAELATQELIRRIDRLEAEVGR